MLSYFQGGTPTDWQANWKFIFVCWLYCTVKLNPPQVLDLLFWQGKKKKLIVDITCMNFSDSKDVNKTNKCNSNESVKCKYFIINANKCLSFWGFSVNNVTVRVANLGAVLALLNVTAAYSTTSSSSTLWLWSPAGRMLEYTGSIWFLEKWTLA